MILNFAHWYFLIIIYNTNRIIITKSFKKCFIIQYTFEKILNSHPPLNTCYDENTKIASHKSPPDKKIIYFTFLLGEQIIIDVPLTINIKGKNKRNKIRKNVKNQIKLS